MAEKMSRFMRRIKTVGRPAVISGCSRNSLPAFFKELGYKVGAEVGVRKGEFTERFCMAGLRMFAIDPWMAYGNGGRIWNDQEFQDDLYRAAKWRLGSYGDMVKIVRKPSRVAVLEFRNRSLDFVYIDGDHEFPEVVFDIYEWGKKVRPGGMVSGHDYFNSSKHRIPVHVKAAVDAIVELQGIENWWVIAHLRRKHRTDEHDKYPGWMWFKR